MSEIKWIIILFLIYSCLQEPSIEVDRVPASTYAYKVITYGNYSIECRGHMDESDTQGTLLETIPLGQNGQAPLRICGENIEDIEIGVNKY